MRNCTTMIYLVMSDVALLASVIFWSCVAGAYDYIGGWSTLYISS